MIAKTLTPNLQGIQITKAAAACLLNCYPDLGGNFSEVLLVFLSFFCEPAGIDRLVVTWGHDGLQRSAGGNGIRTVGLLTLFVETRGLEGS
jgi:hypothetical protein